MRAKKKPEPLGSVRTVADEIEFRKLITAADRSRMAEDVLRAMESIPDHVTRVTVSEWAEKNRYLPSSLTTQPGQFSWDVAPFMREPADCFSQSSDVREMVMMKGAQVTATTAIHENAIGYGIMEAPGGMIFVGGDKGSAETSVELKIDAMIQGCPALASRIFSQSRKKNGKGTGNRKDKKEFPGGFMLAIGPNVGTKLRTFSVPYLFFDEVDAYKDQVGAVDKTKGSTKNEGDPIELAKERTASFELVRKILYLSTPAEEATSKIKPLFLEGDQRYYFVPCPHCGHMQTIRWRDKDGTFRLKFKQDESGLLIRESVHYECEKCEGHWKNDDKAVLLPKGEWRPTAESRREGLRSYHISALYSPLGMRSWEAICQKWIDAKGDMTKLRAFINTVLGETWVEKGDAPRSDLLFSRRGGYNAGTLPPSAKPLLCTVGADIQKDRIECEVVAWGRDMESWSIEYLTLFAGPGLNDAPGETEDLSNVCWQELSKVIESPHAGLRVTMAMIDAGYKTQTVYKFCDRYASGVFPIKGDRNLTEERDGRIYALRDNPPFSTQRADLDTGWLKLDFYQAVKYGTSTGLPPTEPFPGYCHFPMNYGKDHFDKLTSEERLPRRLPTGKVVPKWEKHGRNEPLDCRAYALSAVYILYGERLRELRDQAEDGEKIDYPFPSFWTEWEIARGT